MEIIRRLSTHNINLSSGGHVTLAFIGESVTHGIFDLEDYGDRFVGISDYEAVYHNILKKKLNMFFPNAPVNIINAGINGDSAAGGLKRLERDVLRYDPDLCVVCFGLNDVHGDKEGLERYLSSLRSIFTALKDGGIETIFMTPNMMNTYVSGLCGELGKMIAETTAKLQNGGIMDAYMDGARALCVALDVPVCDCYAKWKALAAAGVDTTRLLSNHINHPSREMHTMFTEMLFDLMMTI